MSNLFDTGIRPVIDAWLLEESKKVRSYGEYWSASSGGYCMRKVIFERLGVPKIESKDDARKQRVFTSGHTFHEWIQGITKNAGLSIAQELELQDEDLMIRGHIDDLVLITEEDRREFVYEGGSDLKHDATVAPEHLILYDYKTVNSRSFMWAKKNGNAMSHYHRMQLGTYMYMLRNGFMYKDFVSKVDAKDLTEARILKIEKENLMMMEQQLFWTPDLERDVVSYWKTLNGYWKSKTLPKCTCADYEGGFLATEKYNNYFYEGEPCSIKYYEKMKAEGKV